MDFSDISLILSALALVFSVVAVLISMRSDNQLQVPSSGAYMPLSGQTSPVFKGAMIGEVAGSLVAVPDPRYEIMGMSPLKLPPL